MQKWRNCDVHQSVEQKDQLVDIGFLVCLLEPKIDHFQALLGRIFRKKLYHVAY